MRYALETGRGGIHKNWAEYSRRTSINIQKWFAEEVIFERELAEGRIFKADIGEEGQEWSEYRQ